MADMTGRCGSIIKRFVTNLEKCRAYSVVPRIGKGRVEIEAMFKIFLPILFILVDFQDREREDRDRSGAFWKEPEDYKTEVSSTVFDYH